MRLKRLKLRNYRAWGAVDLDFDDVKAAVITGKNGTGKSSLAEGIVWCAYGESRSLKSTGVLRKGATDCLGELEFSAGGETYKVVRKVSVRGSGSKAELDLYRRTLETSPVDGVHDDHWEPISGKGMRETQAEILRILGIDCDTLLSASVVMQNDADRLTRAKPEDRRDILRRSLDLDRWRRWLDRARAQSKEQTALANVAAGRAAVVLGLLRAQIATQIGPGVDLPDDATPAALVEALAAHADAVGATVERRRVEVETARTVETQAAASLGTAQAALEAAQRAAAEVETRRAQLATLDDEITAARARHASLAEQAAQLASAVKAEAALPGARADVEAAETALHTLQETKVKVDALLAQRAPLVKLYNDAKGRQGAAEIEAAGLALAEKAAKELPDLKAASEKAAEAVETAADATLAAEKAADTVRAEVVDETPVGAAQATLAQAQRAHLDTGHKARSADVEAHSATLEVERLRKAAERLGQAPCAVAGVTSWRVEGIDEDSPLELLTMTSPCNLAGTCPLIADAVAARDALPAAQERLRTAEAAVTEATTAVGLAKAALDTAQAGNDSAAKLVNEAKADLRRRLAEADTARRTAADAERAARDAWKVARQDETTASNLAASAEAKRAAAARAETEAAEVARLTREGTTIKAQLDTLGTPDVAGAEVRLSNARRSVQTLEATASQRAAAELAGSQREDLTRQIDRQTTERQAVEAEIAQAAGVDDQSFAVMAAEQALTDAKAARELAERAATEAERAHATTGAALDDARQRADEAARDLATAAEHRENARRKDRTAEACALAPTLVIEKAIPVLEAEANRVLAVISTRGMRLRIDTQAETADGGTREVMRFVVTDDAGERDYEDYSGGEQFRIDIALRLGLARLLADREGVPVEWLLIDEGGFGALDVEGIDALKDTVSGLQALYPLVLIITHIDAVADCLPRRIEVKAGPAGSTVEVM